MLNVLKQAGLIRACRGDARRGCCARSGEKRITFGPGNEMAVQEWGLATHAGHLVTERVSWTGFVIGR